MLTADKTIDILEKNFGFKIDRSEIETPKKYSNRCFEIKKEYYSALRYRNQMLEWYGSKKTLPKPNTNTILDLYATYFIVCELLDTGLNLYKRKSERCKNRVELGLVEIEEIEYQNQKYYIISD